MSGFWIPEGVKTIKSSAFNNSEVDIIHLPDTLQYIETSAFSFCKAKEINIPSTVVSIGATAFAYTTGIHKLVLPENVILYPKAFYNTDITSVTFPKGSIQVIDNYSFENDYCFISSDNLEEFIIPEGFTILFFKTGKDAASYIKGAKIDKSFALQTLLKSIPVKDGWSVLRQEYFDASKACNFEKAMKIASDIPVEKNEFAEWNTEEFENMKFM